MPLSIHYRGGSAHGAGLIWDINGSEGDLRITGDSGQLQLAELDLQGGRGDMNSMLPIAVPAQCATKHGERARIGNVRRLYQDVAAMHGIEEGGPPTFDHAVSVHRVLEAIERAAISKQRINLRDI